MAELSPSAAQEDVRRGIQRSLKLVTGAMFCAAAFIVTPRNGSCESTKGDEVHDFEQTIREIEMATDASLRSSLVAKFVDQVKVQGTPVVLGSERAAFVYQGDAERVRVTGDMTNWSSEIALHRVADTDLFVAIERLPSAARLEYVVCTDDQMGRDALCKHQVLNGIGGSSELAMPEYQHHPVFSGEVRFGQRGGYERVKKLTLVSKSLGYDKEVHVYQPLNADEHARFPTVYFHDGRDYIEYAHIPKLLDYLIERQQIQPVIAVFISPPNRHQAEMPNRTTEYGLNPKYVEFVADELVPFIDARFPTVAAASARMTVGDSYAGLVSASIVHSRSDQFGIGYSQSGYLSCHGDALIEQYRNQPKQPIRLYVDVGQYERTVGKGWLPDDEIDFLAANRRFRKVLSGAGYDFEYREYPEGHTWGNWRRHVADALTHYFSSAE